MPSITNSPTPDTTITPSYTPEVLPTLYRDDLGVSMALVPTGPFEMGSEDGGNNQKPVHSVTLDNFYLDQYEVTNARYAECDDAGVCDPPSNNKSYTRESYYENPEFAEYPVIYVSWHDAQAYCRWRDARLPTEAEWEKAARGGLEGELYPWGNEFDGNRTNFCDSNCEFEWANTDFDDGYAETAPVGSYPAGMSPYRVYDLAGNVWEWTADWYDLYPGGDPTASDNFGETFRVLRGGSWTDDSHNLRVANRYNLDPGSAYYDIGFRCARSP